MIRCNPFGDMVPFKMPPTPPSESELNYRIKKVIERYFEAYGSECYHMGMEYGKGLSNERQLPDSELLIECEKEIRRLISQVYNPT